MIITVSLRRPAEFNGKAPVWIIYFRRSCAGEIHKDALVIVIQSSFEPVFLEPGHGIVIIIIIIFVNFSVRTDRRTKVE